MWIGCALSGMMAAVSSVRLRYMSFFRRDSASDVARTPGPATRWRLCLFALALSCQSSIFAQAGGETGQDDGLLKYFTTDAPATKRRKVSDAEVFAAVNRFLERRTPKVETTSILAPAPQDSRRASDVEVFSAANRFLERRPRKVETVPVSASAEQDSGRLARLLKRLEERARPYLESMERDRKSYESRPKSYESKPKSYKSKLKSYDAKSPAPKTYARADTPRRATPSPTKRYESPRKTTPVTSRYNRPEPEPVREPTRRDDSEDVDEPSVAGNNLRGTEFHRLPSLSRAPTVYGRPPQRFIGRSAPPSLQQSERMNKADKRIWQSNVALMPNARVKERTRPVLPRTWGETQRKLDEVLDPNPKVSLRDFAHTPKLAKRRGVSEVEDQGNGYGSEDEPYRTEPAWKPVILGTGAAVAPSRVENRTLGQKRRRQQQSRRPAFKSGCSSCP